MKRRNAARKYNRYHNFWDRVARDSVNEKVMNESAYSFACKMIWFVREREGSSEFRLFFSFYLPLFFFSKRNIHAMRLYINNVFLFISLNKAYRIIGIIHFEGSRMVFNEGSKRFFKVD